MQRKLRRSGLYLTLVALLLTESRSWAGATHGIADLQAVQCTCFGSWLSIRLWWRGNREDAERQDASKDDP
jgi:hypothetical protein